MTVIQKKRRGATHHGKLREAALAAALDVVDREGYGALTLRAVAARTGVTHVALYRHFASREALIAAIAEEGFHMLRDAMTDAVNAHEDPVARFEAIGHAYVRFGRDHRAHFRMMYTDEVQRAAFPELSAAAREALGVVLETVRSCRAAGVLRDDPDVELAMTAWSQVHGLTMLINEHQFTDAGVDDDRVVKTATRALLEGILRRDAKRPKK